MKNLTIALLIHRSLIIYASLLALSPLAVNAGDLDEPTIQMASAPIVDWSGSYVGGYLTYGDGSYQQFSARGLGSDIDVDGLGFGVRYGRNW